MPKYKTPDGNGVSIGGAYFVADKSGCITVPGGHYHSLLAPLGCELQPEKTGSPAASASSKAVVTATP